jgi:hypothetical protein
MKNKTATQIKSPGRRAAAYWFVDGLPEIAFGIILLMFGVFAIVSIGIHRPNEWIFGVGLSVIFLYCLVFTRHRPILDYFKARITYPRTGYARPPIDLPPKWPDRILTLGMANRIDENASSFRNHTVVLFFYGSFLMMLLTIRWLLPLTMMAIAAAIYFQSRDDVRPYSWSAVLPIAAGGFIAAAFDLTAEACAYAPIVIGGAWLLGVGSWTLFRYLRVHPRLDAGKEEPL